MKNKFKKNIGLSVASMLLLLTAQSFATIIGDPSTAGISISQRTTKDIQEDTELGIIRYSKVRTLPSRIEMCCHVEEKLDPCAKSTFNSRSPQRVGRNFTSATLSNSFTSGTPILDLYTNGWVGQEQYLLVSGPCIRSFNKRTGRPDGVLDTDLGTFFNGNTTLPGLVYDRFSNRWFVSTLFGPPSSFPFSGLAFSFSDNGIITDHTIWNTLTFEGTSNQNSEYIAADEKNIYLTTYFDDGSANSIIAIDKATLFEQSPTVGIFDAIQEPSGTLFDTLVPANNFDIDPKFGYFISTFYGNNINTSSTQLLLYRLELPLSPTSLSNAVSIPVAEYFRPSLAPHKGNLYGTNGNISVVGGINSVAHVRDHQLFVCQTIKVNSEGVSTDTGDRDAIRWYQFDLTGDRCGQGGRTETSSTVPTLIQEGLIFDSNATTAAPKYYYCPSIMTNKFRDVVVGGTVSGLDDFVNTFFAGRKRGQPRAHLGNPTLLTNTTFPFNFSPIFALGISILSQFSGMSPEPIKDSDIWYTGNFAGVENGWGIQTTKLKPPLVR